MGWEYRNLGDLCEVIAGQSPEGKFYNDNGEGLPFYQGKKDFGDKYIDAPRTWTKKITKQAKDGDILMSVRAPVGPINFSVEDICIGRGLAAIRSSAALDKDFLFYVLLSKQDEIKGHEGAVFASINKKQIEQLSIPNVTLAEQQRIVAILDQAFADIEKARANAEKNLKNARELSMASIRETFLSANNTELLTIDELADVITDYVANGSFAALAENVQYKSEKDYAILLRLVDHSKSYKNDFVYINQHAFTFLKKSVVVPNDIILSNVGARLGTVFRAPDLGMPMSLGPNSILIKSTEYGDYLYCWLQSAYGQSEIKSIVSGAGQPKFNKTQFKQLFVPVPKSVSERAEIVERIESITQMLEHLESIYSRKLTALEELKKSLLQKAFSGELTKTEGQAA